MIGWTGFLGASDSKAGFLSSMDRMDNVVYHVGEVFYQIKWDPLRFICTDVGLRQGDPLSPFLFLFVADRLSAILRSKVLSGDIVPVKVCRRSPGIFHLLFADDTLLCFVASHD